MSSDTNSNKPKKKVRDAWMIFSSGAMAAMTGGMVTHPIDLIKVRAQLYGSKDGFGLGSSHTAKNETPNMLRIGRDVLKKEGVTGIYRGLSASLMRQATFIGTKFTVYDVSKKAMVSPDGSLSFPGKVACGLVAGACGGILGNPFDMAMVRMQADGRVPVEHRRNYKNGADAILRVIKEEGVATLWRGCIPTVSRGMVITASQLAVYDDVKTNLIKHTSMTDTPTTHVAASLVCSVVAAFTSNPFDVTKSRLQQMKVRKKDGKYPYKNMIDCFIKTYRQEGFMALYKGIGPTIARQIPLNITRFVVAEQLLQLMERDATSADL